MAASISTSRICPGILLCQPATTINRQIGATQREVAISMVRAIIHFSMIIKEITLSCWTQVLRWRRDQWELAQATKPLIRGKTITTLTLTVI
jgi:hypothetical protein